jgi:hypothetical protein
MMTNQLHSKRRLRRKKREAAATHEIDMPRGSGPDGADSPPRGIAERIVWRPIGELKPFPGNPRRHPESQIASLMKAIGRVWTNPILTDEDGVILAGHGRHQAAIRLGMERVPTWGASRLAETSGCGI